MKILFLVENYHGFYTNYLQDHPHLRQRSYENQCSALFERAFYQSDSYAYWMRQLGHETSQVIMDCPSLQRKWAEECGLFVPSIWLGRRPWRWFWKMISKDCALPSQWRSQILLEQIKRIRPDVLYVFSHVPVDKNMLSYARRYTRHLVCQWSCPILEDYPFHSYDLIISSSKTLTERFRHNGHKTAYLPHAFDDRILARVDTNGRRDGVVFVGSLIPSVHKDRMAVLNHIAHNTNIDFYGVGVEHLPGNSPLYNKFLGKAFGIDMYKLYSRYKIAIHAHGGEFAKKFVSAKRIFEITGAGAMLLTDSKKDLGNFFEAGEEIVAYTDSADCLNKLRYYLAHEDECDKIAQAGQRRTLRDHTFKQRMKTLSDILEKTLP